MADDFFVQLLNTDINYDDNCENKNEDFMQENEEEELSQLGLETNEDISDETSELSIENDDFFKAIDFVSDYHNVISLNDKADIIYKQVQSWVECCDTIKEDPTFLSLLQKPENNKIWLTVTSKTPLNLGTPTLILVCFNQSGTSKFTTPIRFSQTCKSNILFTPPSNYQNLNSAYLILSFKINKNEYSSAKNVYQKCQSDENGEEMDVSPAIYDNDDRNGELQDKTENCSSNLKGDFEGEILHLANFFKEDDDSTSYKSETGDSNLDDSISCESEEEETDDFKQIITYKLKLHIC